MLPWDILVSILFSLVVLLLSFVKRGNSFFKPNNFVHLHHVYSRKDKSDDGTDIVQFLQQIKKSFCDVISLVKVNWVMKIYVKKQGSSAFFKLKPLIMVLHKYCKLKSSYLILFSINWKNQSLRHYLLNIIFMIKRKYFSKQLVYIYLLFKIRLSQFRTLLARDY